jgi:hypothetical protein
MAKIRKVTRLVGGANTNFTLNYKAARETRYMSLAGGFYIGLPETLEQHAESQQIPSPFFLSATEAEALVKLDVFIAAFEKEKVSERKVIRIDFERSSKNFKSVEKERSWRQFTDEAKIEFKYEVLIERKLGGSTTYYHPLKKGEKEMSKARTRYGDARIVAWTAQKENRLHALYSQVENVGESVRNALKELKK